MTADPDRPADSRPDIERLGSRIVYENRWIRVREDSIRRRDGSTSIFGVIERADFVVVAAVEPDGAVHLVQQYRYPIGRRSWEFPQGAWGEPGADPALAARAELREETGLEAATLLHAGRIQHVPGMLDQRCDVFLATGLTQGPTAREAEEQDMVARRVPRAAFLAMLRDGTVDDSVTLAAYGLLTARGLM